MPPSTDKRSKKADIVEAKEEGSGLLTVTEDTVSDVSIPDKSYFKIGEVSKIVGVEPYNIRYWESQFRQIRPSKTKSRQRLYRRQTIELLLKIKSLLYDQGYTISGAKRHLQQQKKDSKAGGVQPRQGELGMASEERDAYGQQLAEAEAERQELKTQMASLTERLDASRDAHKESLEQLAEARNILAEKESASTGEQEEYQQALKELSVKVTELELEKSGLEERLKASAEETAELMAASTDNVEKDRENSALAEKLSQSESELKDWRKKADKLQERCEKQAQDIAEIQGEVAALATAKEEAVSALSKAEDQLGNLNKSIAEDSEKSVELEGLNSELERLSEELKTMKSERKRLLSHVIKELKPLLSMVDGK